MPSEPSAPSLWKLCLLLPLHCSFKLTEDELAEGKPPCIFWYVELLKHCMSRDCLNVS